MTTHDNPYTIPGLAGTNLLGLTSDIQERLIDKELNHLNLTGEAAEAFRAGALWAVDRFQAMVLSNMPPDGPQPDGTELYTGRYPATGNIINPKTIDLNGVSYRVGAMRCPSGGYWAAYLPEGWERWKTDGEPHLMTRDAILAAIEAAEVDRMARG